ncbi:MAG: hypothetical protein KGS60_17910 [Verrucomicrobia bacterium]|nr:hypothetical protein [Verrucomicrobiota bacterium]
MISFPATRIGVIALLLCTATAYAAPHTPKVGSPERLAICDALRLHVAGSIANSRLPKKIVFKIEDLNVDGDFAFFGGFPIFEDGTDAIPDFLPDVFYCFLLRKKGTGWNVIADFSGSDVPEPAWWRTMRQKLPAGVPAAIFPEFYRDHLGL